jgi:hypothetical protein
MDTFITEEDVSMCWFLAQHDIEQIVDSNVHIYEAFYSAILHTVGMEYNIAKSYFLVFLVSSMASCGVFFRFPLSSVLQTVQSNKNIPVEFMEISKTYAEKYYELLSSLNTDQQCICFYYCLLVYSSLRSILMYHYTVHFYPQKLNSVLKELTDFRVHATTDWFEDYVSELL